MSAADKLRNDAEDLKGKIKQKAGDWTDNESLEAEGREDQVKADLKNAGENLKDVGRGAKEALTD